MKHSRKWNSSYYNTFFTSITGKKPPLPSNFCIFIQKPAKTFELLHNHFNLVVLSFCECSWLRRYVLDKHFFANGTGLVTYELPKPEPLLSMIMLRSPIVLLISCQPQTFVFFFMLQLFLSSSNFPFCSSSHQLNIEKSPRFAFNQMNNSSFI